MTRRNKADEIEHQKKIYQISLLLRRKPMAFIIEYMRAEWHIEKAQAYRYIAAARKEWKKYFEKLKKDGMAYHVAQIRDLKDKAYTENDMRLVLDITKEEAKLMGIYPAEKYEETRKVIILGKKKGKDEEEGKNE